MVVLFGSDRRMGSWRLSATAASDFMSPLLIGEISIDRRARNRQNGLPKLFKHLPALAPGYGIWYVTVQ